MKSIIITEYHANKFRFCLLTPWKQRRFLDKKMTRSNLLLKKMSDKLSYDVSGMRNLEGLGRKK